MNVINLMNIIYKQPRHRNGAVNLYTIFQLQLEPIITTMAPHIAKETLYT